MTKPETEKLPVLPVHSKVWPSGQKLYTGSQMGEHYRKGYADALRAQGGGERCDTCDGTGSVHRADGEYMGECHCNTPDAAPDAEDDTKRMDWFSGGIDRFLSQCVNGEWCAQDDVISAAFGATPRAAIDAAIAHARSAGGEDRE